MLIDKVNEDINLPFVSEQREERMIERMVDRIMPQVEPSLNFLLPEVYVRCLKIALDETLHIKKRRENISEILRGELADPLAKALNERVDCSILPEAIEGQVLKIVANKIIDKFVKWTVGEIDEQFEEDSS